MRLELTKRADYAIRTVVALAAADPDERLSVRRIAIDQDIPVRFLAQVMADLVSASIVDGQTGRSGGYRLARSATAIALLEVIEAVEGDSRRRGCVLRRGPCRVAAMCDAHAVFAAGQDDLLERFRATSIASLRPASRSPLLNAAAAPSPTAAPAEGRHPQLPSSLGRHSFEPDRRRRSRAC